MKGVVDFYETFAKAFPDFQIIVHTENDLPGLSLRELQIEATHSGESCGLQATGRRVSIPLIGLFLFDKTTGYLNAERIYFDNNTILTQIRGEMTSRRRLRPRSHRTPVNALKYPDVFRQLQIRVDQVSAPLQSRQWVVRSQPFAPRHGTVRRLGGDGKHQPARLWSGAEIFRACATALASCEHRCFVLLHAARWDTRRGPLRTARPLARGDFARSPLRLGGRNLTQSDVTPPQTLKPWRQQHRCRRLQPTGRRSLPNGATH